MCSPASMLGSRSRASSPGRRRLLALSRRRFHRRDRGGFNRLGFVPDRGLELSESLAQRSACVGEPLGPEEYERDAEQDDQMGGLEESGEHGFSSFLRGGSARRRGGERRRLLLPAA